MKQATDHGLYRCAGKQRLELGKLFVVGPIIYVVSVF